MGVQSQGNRSWMPAHLEALGFDAGRQRDYDAPYLERFTVSGTGDNMATGNLDLSDLGRLVATERQRRGMSLRETAAAVGIPFNTLARVEKGHVPDLPKFKRLIEWCGADINKFFELQQKSATTTDIIAEHLQSDPNLSSGAADQIASIVNDLYRALAQPQVSAVHLRAATTFRPDAASLLGVLLNDMHTALLKESIDGPEKRI